MRIDKIALIEHIHSFQTLDKTYTEWAISACVKFGVMMKRIDTEYLKLMEKCLTDEKYDGIWEFIELRNLPFELKTKPKSEIIAGHFDGKNRDHNGRIIVNQEKKFKGTGKPTYGSTGILPNSKDKRK